MTRTGSAAWRAKARRRMVAARTSERVFIIPPDVNALLNRD
jgi:hypothetical protein